MCMISLIVFNDKCPSTKNQIEGQQDYMILLLDPTLEKVNTATIVIMSKEFNRISSSSTHLFSSSRMSAAFSLPA